MSARQLVQVIDAGFARSFIEGNRELGNFVVRLDFSGVLVQHRLGSLGSFFELAVTRAVVDFFSAHCNVSFSFCSRMPKD